MTPDGGRFLRDNAFLVAAVALPAVVVGFFLLASAIPRWRVPPPAYDLLMRAVKFDQMRPTSAVDFTVRAGRVEATVRSVPATAHAQPWALMLFDHKTMTVREIPVELPSNVAEGDPPRTVVIEALAGRRVLDQVKAPDGYELQTRNSRSPGLVGELFGMRRYDRNAALVNNGRVIPITLPSPYQYSPPLSPVGWLADEGPR